jgi:signal transduction histidine kinase
VAGRRRLGDLRLGTHLRRRSARFRLTALYCCLFFPSGVVLVAITYVLIVVVQRPLGITEQVQALKVSTHLARGSSLAGLPSGSLPAPSGGDGTSPSLGRVTVTLPGHIILDPREFLVGSCIVLVALSAISVLLGWIVAGRVLRPLRVMTTTTRQISERNLHERLALSGPEDELKDLGDTIDGLLGRLEAAFDSQRRFVANASHELRTPLMLSQTLLQVALANPKITLESLRAACREAIDTGKDQARLIDALLALARGQRGLDHRELVDLTAVVRDALKALEPAAMARGLQVDAALDRTEVSGDTQLIERLVSNLLDNAIRYNLSRGRVEVGLAAASAEATLTVTNTGPLVAPDQVGRLLEPFQRAAPDRTAGPNGLGLGLSIVADIAEAHGAALEIHPGPQGGLTITVSFPVAGRSQAVL